MDPATRGLIKALHATAVRQIWAVTGGGTGAVAQLLSVPGGSRTIVDVVVPYSERALADFLGRAPDQACSLSTACLMAERALARLSWLAPGEPGLGVAVTASLATDRPKRGDHRFHLAIAAPPFTRTRSLTLAKGVRDRQGEEDLLDRVLLNLLAETLGIGAQLSLPLQPGETVEADEVVSTGALARFLGGATQTLLVDLDGRTRLEAPKPTLLVPGSFHPIHAGHWGLAEVAARQCGRPAAFELSVTNVDKPSLTLEEVHHRLLQFAWRAPLWLTRAPTFREKADLFPGVLFAVGADTAERIVAPRYYGDSTEQMLESLAAIRRQGCRFLVAGRVDRAGRFTQLADLAIPEPARDLFSALPPDFRIDLSSTELRAHATRAE